jgi:hypothetical protein
VIVVCEHCGMRLRGKRAHAPYCDSLCRGDAIRLRRELLGAGEKALGSAQDGVGSRGGNVRGMDEARDLQTESKDKRDWAGAIDEQIRHTLLATGAFHADDLDELQVPPEHSNTKGLRIGSFSRRELMESTGVYRTVSHAAANARKAPIYRITEKGRQELSKLVGVDAGGSSTASGVLGSFPERSEAEDEAACSPAPSVDPGESEAGGQRADHLRSHDVGTSASAPPEPLQFDLPESPGLFDYDRPEAA